jgi:predicted transcriptional regulator
MAKTTVSFRLDEELVDRLRKATVESRSRFAPSMTAVIERGIELALRELEKGR